MMVSLDLSGDALPVGLVDLPAFFSACGRYRYWLARDIGGDGRGGPALFILHNPSTADASRDDPTIRRCIGYARRFGCRRMIAVNRVAVRATDPAAVFTAADPVGPLNDAAIARAAAVVGAACGIIVAAWGAFGTNAAQRRVCQRRDEAVVPLLAEAELHALGVTRAGHPRHPLYLAATARPRSWRPPRPTEV